MIADEIRFYRATYKKTGYVRPWDTRREGIELSHSRDAKRAAKSASAKIASGSSSAAAADVRGNHKSKVIPSLCYGIGLY